MPDHPKYSQAVTLFRHTELSRKEICTICNLTLGEFSAHLQRYHRDLIITRLKINSNLKVGIDTKLRGKVGQTIVARDKYKKAIKACRSVEFIQCNISEIARRFKLSPTGLGNQLRAHFPDIIEWRLAEQIKLGIVTYQHSRVVQQKINIYADAIEILRNSDVTFEEAASMCGVSFSGLKQHILYYHRDIVKKRRTKRDANCGQRYLNRKTGSNSTHKPRGSTVEKYAEGIRLFQSSSLTMKQIAAKLNISYAGFYGYVRVWHRNLIVERRGIQCNEDVETVDLNCYKHYRKSTREKYAEAISFMKENSATAAETARRFSLRAESFRSYLREHEPTLSNAIGWMITPEGKKVYRKSYIKYKDAIEMLKSSSESFKVIAQKFNLNPISFGHFTRRNYPEILDMRNKRKK